MAMKSNGGKNSANGKKNGHSAHIEAQDAIALLKADHRKVEGLFDKYEAATAAQKKADLAKQICQELIIHTMIEEEIFYPAVRSKIDDDDKMNEAQVEHDSAKALIAELLAGSPDQTFYDAKVKVLSEQIKHHVHEEEARSEGIFAEARAAGVDTEGLGAKMTARKEELMAQAKAGDLPPPKRPSFDTAAGTRKKPRPGQGVAIREAGR